MTTYLQGSKLIFYALKNGVMVKCAGSTTGNLTLNTEIKIATKPPQSRFQSTYPGIISYTISDTGVCSLDDTLFTHFDFIKMQMTGTPLQWIMRDIDNANEFYTGFATISSWATDSDVSGLRTYTVQASGDGDISLVNPYSIVLFGLAPDTVLTPDNVALIGRLETGGLPPIN